MKPRLSSWFALKLSFLAAVPGLAAQWPGWRGPEGNGTSAEKNIPVRWSPTENLRWKVELPEPGNSSPIVWGNRVFVSQAVKSENRRTLLCFDLETGKLLWQSGLTYAEPESTQENNPYCAGTPATDGERVYVSFGSAGVVAYDFSGKQVWHRDLGKLEHMFGTAVSPVLHGDLCFLNHGPGPNARLIALNRKSGEIVWETQPPQPEPAEVQQANVGGRGGPGGGGGRGGFGPAAMLAGHLVSQGDKNQDKTLSAPELLALAEVWFDKLDPQRTGKLTLSQFTDSSGQLFPPPADAAGPGAGPGGPGGGPSRFIAPGLFAATDADKDATLTRAEWTGAFAAWAKGWDSSGSGVIAEDKVREGLATVFPPPNPGGGRGGGPGGRGGGGAGGGSWSTPVIVKAGGRSELVVSFPFRLAAFDPSTGKQLWFSKGLGSTVYTTPLWNGERLYASSGGPGGGSAIAVAPGGSGDVTDSLRAWRLDRVKSAFGSGVIHEGHIYSVSQEGIAECVELATGKPVWQERLSGPGSQTSTWSSTLLVDGRVYVPNKSGDVFVFRAAPKFEVLATNSVGEPTNASLAAAQNSLLLRTSKSLWCFGTPRP